MRAPRQRTSEREWIEFILQVLLPHGGYVAVFTRQSNNLVAYFDESMSGRKLPLTSVAGYLFEPREYLEFDKGMKKVLREHKLCYFRMAECLHWTDEFSKYSKTSPEPEIIEREVIRLIRKHAVLGVGAAVSEALYNLMQPAVQEKICGVYAMLCQWCLAEIGNWADRKNFHGDIAYFF
jgi:hypothetical protein